MNAPKEEKITVSSFRRAIACLKGRFESEHSVIEDDSHKICFVGDIHGDMDAIKKIERIADSFDRIVFLGDFVDRGTSDIEVVYEISRMKSKLGDKIVILAGNHDAYSDVSPRDFDEKLANRFGSKGKKLEQEYIEAFGNAPIAYLNEGYGLIALHGFIPADRKDWDIGCWKKVKEDIYNSAFQVLWNDPKIIASGLRGKYMQIVDSKTIEEFFRYTRLKVIVRSHQPEINQIFKLKSGKVVTLGSCALYGKRNIFILPEFKLVEL